MGRTECALKSNGPCVEEMLSEHSINERRAAMKGAIFKLFEDFVTTAHGPDAFDDLLDITELQTVGPIVGPGTYPAEDLLALVGSAVTAYEQPVDDLLRAFGRHAFPALARSIPELMVGLDDPHTFLMSLESVIHTEVRKLDHEANPARFAATEVASDELLLGYESGFGLFPLVEGFLDGLGDWYGTPLHHERVSTDGTNAMFRIKTGQAAHLAASAASGTSLDTAPDGAVI